METKHLSFVGSVAFGLVSLSLACAGSNSDRAPGKPVPSASAETAGPAQAPTPQDRIAAAQNAVEDLESSLLTTAPLRAKAVAQLDASVEEVWGYVSNHNNLVEYAGSTGIKHATIDNANADEENGVGCTRECLANENDRFVEEVVYFRAPYVFAYSAVENTWGLTDHVAVVIVRPTADGKAELEWRQYFNTAKPEMAEMMGTNLQGILSGPLLGFFVTKFGGEVLGA